MISKFLAIWKKALIMFSVGIVFGLLINRNFSASPTYFISDMLFICAMVFLVCGLYQFVSNMGIFNSMVFGTKTLARLFRSKLGPSEQVKDEYIDYVKSRRKFTDVIQLLVISVVLIIISVLVSLV